MKKGKLRLNFVEFSIDDLIEDLKSIFELSIQAKGISLLF
jgi:hypothetical protein